MVRSNRRDLLRTVAVQIDDRIIQDPSSMIHHFWRAHGEQRGHQEANGCTYQVVGRTREKHRVRTGGSPRAKYGGSVGSMRLGTGSWTSITSMPIPPTPFRPSRGPERIGVGGFSAYGNNKNKAGTRARGCDSGYSGGRKAIGSLRSPRSSDLAPKRPRLGIDAWESEEASGAISPTWGIPHALLRTPSRAQQIRSRSPSRSRPLPSSW